MNLNEHDTLEWNYVLQIALVQNINGWLFHYQYWNEKILPNLVIGARGVGDLPSAPGNWPRRVLPEKLSGGLRPTSQNPYPLYDQNRRFLLPYLGPDQKFDSLFMTVARGWHSCPRHTLWRAFVEGLIDNDEKVASAKKHTQLKTRVLKPYPIYNQNGQNRYPIYDPNGWKTLPFGTSHTDTYIAHIREYPPPGLLVTLQLVWHFDEAGQLSLYKRSDKRILKFILYAVQDTKRQASSIKQK